MNKVQIITAMHQRQLDPEQLAVMALVPLDAIAEPSSASARALGRIEAVLENPKDPFLALSRPVPRGLAQAFTKHLSGYDEPRYALFMMAHTIGCSDTYLRYIRDGKTGGKMDELMARRLEHMFGCRLTEFITLHIGSGADLPWKPVVTYSGKVSRPATKNKGSKPRKAKKRARANGAAGTSIPSIPVTAVQPEGARLPKGLETEIEVTIVSKQVFTLADVSQGLEELLDTLRANGTAEVTTSVLKT